MIFVINPYYVCHFLFRFVIIYHTFIPGIALLQWSMIVGSICAFISLTLAIIALFGRKSRFLMGIVYAIIFFAVGASKKCYYIIMLF